MQISQTEMNAMHDIQYEMLKDLIVVLKQLNIKYYFVHGSLLGAVRDHDFIDEDDDIDIAIFRKDYNRLMFHGPALLKGEYFLQNSPNDRFPLAFGKMRNNNTAFIQPVLKNIKCNKGIYIDIFPIDYENTSLIFRFKQLVYEYRINQMLSIGAKSLKSRILGGISKMLCLSFDQALLKREILYSSSPKNDFVVIYGGKGNEHHMPIEWFNCCVYTRFRDIDVSCPIGYASYLALIYGKEYMNHNPAVKRIEGEKIEISADVLDFNRSYLEYIDS